MAKRKLKQRPCSVTAAQCCFLNHGRTEAETRKQQLLEPMTARADGATLALAMAAILTLMTMVTMMMVMRTITRTATVVRLTIIMVATV